MTLIEVICVVGIVASLAALMFPTFASSRRAAQVGVCLSNVQQWERALKL
ncbi:MAG TPA: type II secretion system protein [Fimbriimonadaceae bacterium]|nr:type II secretion system protein [Fimbriimonadaceae bacterium]